MGLFKRPLFITHIKKYLINIYGFIYECLIKRHLLVIYNKRLLKAVLIYQDLKRIYLWVYLWVYLKGPYL